MGWIQTYSGKQFFPLNPTVTSINLIDIAHALSHVCRYNGHSVMHYSVAEHSLLLAKHFRDVPELSMLALMHDAHEAYCPDIPRPLKPALPEFERIAAGIQETINIRFELPHEMPESIKDADWLICHDERVELLGDEVASWGIPEGLGVKIRTLAASDARAFFLIHFGWMFELLHGGLEKLHFHEANAITLARRAKGELFDKWWLA